VDSARCSDNSVKFKHRGDKVLTDQEYKRPRLWISYPWADKMERDFDFLVPQLRMTNIEATYDSLQMVPDSKLHERILQRLRSIGFDGWLYILTQPLLGQQTCTDELISAINLTYRQMGSNFAMMGLLDGVAARNLPLMLRTRPCYSLEDPGWARQVSDALRQRNVSKKQVVRIETRFIWTVHSCWEGDPSKTAIEVYTDGETIPYWRFAIPKWSQQVQWGIGTVGLKEISPVKLGVANGSGRCENSNVIWFGAANKVDRHQSAFVVFSGRLPDFVCFGPADSLLGPPGKVEVFQTTVDRPLLLQPA